MTTITTRSGKGSPLTNDEVDANFTNLNSDKVEASGDSMTGNLSFGDNNKIILGSGSDLQLYHNGNNSYVQDAGTGKLHITSNGTGVSIDKGTSELMATFDIDGAVTLYHDNSSKLATTSTGIDVTGTVVADGLESSGGLTFTAADGIEISGKESIVMRIDSDDNDANRVFNVVSGTSGSQETLINASEDAGVSLYYDNAAKLATTSYGVDITGRLVTTSHIDAPDNAKIRLGDGDDLQIYHSGSHSFISEAGTGDLYIGASSNIALMNAAFSENKLLATTDGALKLYYDGSQKLSTTSTGIDVTGSISADGLTVDGQGKIQGTFALLDLVETDITDKNTRVITSGGQFRVDTVNDALSSSTKRIMVDHATGDISFYEDTGTTAKLFWDASAESLGIGTSSPVNDSGYTGLTLSGSQGGQVVLQDDGTTEGLIWTNNALNVEAKSTNPIVFRTNSAERMRISSDGSCRWTPDGTNPDMTLDASGNLLVGTTSAFGTTGTTINQAGLIFSSADGDRSGQFDRTTSDGEIVRFTKAGSTVGSISTAFGYIAVGTGDTGISFRNDLDSINPFTITGNTNRGAAIDLGADGTRFKDLYLSGIIYGVQQTLTRDSGAPLELNRTTNDGELVYFKQSGIVRGSISISGSTTSYNTTSDYRLKENVVAMSGATERLKQLNPSRFNFVGDTDTTVDGFLAHEVANVVPEAITGAKDAMRDEEYEVTPAVLDDDGNVVTEAVMGTRSVPDYQGIDQSKLVPLLVATIQELEARIAALESN